MDSVRMKSGYLNSHDKKECYGCEACAGICPKAAISMSEDEYGFRYPSVDYNLCIKCGLCNKVCPAENNTERHENLASYGGYYNDRKVREQSTSGGAFSAILRTFLSPSGEPHIVYGAAAKGIDVSHESSSKYEECQKFRSSKYTQSHINNAYDEIAEYLKNGTLILFSGTPCQVAGLLSFLSVKKVNASNLVTVEVLCAGVPTPILFRKYDQYLKKKYGFPIKDFYWRYKDKNRWDYNCCSYVLQNGKKRVIDRWFSGYWSLFTQRLLMRPSCETCPFKGSERVADISLGDLWGVDREYPELYDHNRGTSWILCNTEKGVHIFSEAKSRMTCREVQFERMKKYQIPSISGKAFHPDYHEFIEDLQSLDYVELCRKWAKKPTFKLLWQKYVYNNASRVRIWKLKQITKSIVRMPDLKAVRIKKNQNNPKL